MMEEKSFFLFIRHVFSNLFERPFRFEQILRHMEFIGNESLGIILLTGFFTGAVFGLQIGSVFAIFGTQSLLGGATALALASELSPLISSFILSGRVGSSMAAEISTMSNSDQIEALEAIGVSPIKYLVIPRVWASMIMMPLLAAVFMFIGVVGAKVVGVFFFEIDEGRFDEKVLRLVEVPDVLKGLRKMFIFSLIISIGSCYKGITATKGAKGVGLATTEAVISTLLFILFSDFVISYIQVRWGV